MDLLKTATRNVLRNRRRSGVTVAAMSAALWVMILYSGVITGYIMSVERNLLDFELGDIQIHAPGYRDNPSIYTRIENADAVTAALRKAGLTASSRLIAAGLAAVKDASAGAVFWGIDTAYDKTVSKIHTAAAEGSRLESSDDHAVVIGAQMAENLNAKIGDEVVVLSQATDGSTANELYTIKGILKNISGAVDRSGVFMTDAAFRNLMALDEGVHRIIVRRPEGMSLEEAKRIAVKAAPGLEVKTWRELSPTLGSMMDSVQSTMYAMFFIVYVVVGILILNAMLMAVFERIREFGVLKALGVGPLQVLQLIFIEGMLQTFIAVLIGTLFAIPGLYYLKTVGLDMSGFGNISIQGVVWDPIWRAHISAATFIGPVITLAAVVSVALIYPALKAATLSPVNAIHHQ
jgi:putative ABC transport system permease protein